MDRKKELEYLKKEYLEIEVPRQGVEQLKVTIQNTKLEKRRRKMRKRIKNMSLVVVAAAAMVVVLPNANSTIARAMVDIPVIGSIFKVVTFRDYEYEDDYHSAKVEVPKIEINSEVKVEETSINEINKEVEEYTNRLIEQFKKDLNKEEQYYKGLDVSYQVVTDTVYWFTLRIDVTETMGSSNSYSRYYHIDRTTRKVVQLREVFQEGSNYVERISNEIKNQMQEQMNQGEENCYWLNEKEQPENIFKQISENQNFYFNSKGELVIVFDKYEVAPGAMGCPEFMIPNEIIAGILK